jgi:quercetin dioxygenase-like cupin family protein
MTPVPPIAPIQIPEETHESFDPQRRALFEYAFGAGLATLVAGGASLAQAAPGAGGQQAATATVPGISLAKGVRRIITGHNAQGKSHIIKDDRITGGTFPSLYKATLDQPLGPGLADETAGVRPTDAPALEPVLGGSSFHFVTLPPTPKGAKPGWHRTETLDYNILMGGELVLVLDEGETKLYPGDVVIQRNTLHAWRNDTNQPVYWVAVLVPMKLPKR